MVHEQSGDTPRQTLPSQLLLYAPQTAVQYYWSDINLQRIRHRESMESVAQEVYGNRGNVYTKSDSYGNPT